MSPRVVFALLMAGVASIAGMDQCAIDCTHGYQFTADPMNCKNYYICYGYYEHSEFPFDCDGSTYFDIVSHTCKDLGYTCTPECEKCSFGCANPVLGKIANTLDCGVYYTCADAAWTECPPEMPYFNGDVCQANRKDCCTCKSLCTESDVINRGLVRDFKNCTNYYLCLEEGIPDETTHGHCPTGTVFDGQLKHCEATAPCVEPCA